MRSYMLDSCAKAANNLRTERGIACEHLPTVVRAFTQTSRTMWESPLYFTQFVYKLYTVDSTVDFTISPLLIGEISPLSTLPITDTTFYKKGEI